MVKSPQRASVTASLVLCLMSALKGSPGSADQGKPRSLDASYFRDLLERKGAAGIMDGLYVAPPDLMTPLFSGIATGAPDWLDVYDRFRRNVDSVDRSGVTKGRLDDSLAQALAQAPGRILQYLHQHREIATQSICSRPAGANDDPANVLDDRELLTIARRERSVKSAENPATSAERSECLAALFQLLRRQLRIYLASFGAKDSTNPSFPKLSMSEQVELRPVIDSARRDPALSALGDGTFPDGPIRLGRIPREALKPCLDDDGRIANPEGPWEFSDVLTDARIPRARLLNACRVASNEWTFTCERGGYSTSLGSFRARQVAGRWEIVSEAPPRTLGGWDVWAECRRPSKGTPPSNRALQPDDHLGRPAPSNGRR
jgi:hypothetical protein